MKNRGNASKRAINELFSNSTEEIKCPENTGIPNSSKRDELKSQLFGTSAKATSNEAVQWTAVGTVRPQAMATLSQTVRQSNISDSPRMTSSAVRTAPRQMPPSAQYGGENGRTVSRASRPVQNSIGQVPPSVQAVGENGRVPVSPRAARPVQNRPVQMPPSAMPGERTIAFNKVQASYMGASDTETLKKEPAKAEAKRTAKSKAAKAAKKAAKEASKAAKSEAKFEKKPAWAESVAKTAENTENSNNESAKPKKKTKWLPAVISASLVLVIGVAAAVGILLSGEEEVFVPADITAGLASPAPVRENTTVMSDSAARYLSEERHSVTFNFYEAPSVTCTTPDITVGELMTKLGIVCGENNRMAYTAEDKVAEDMTISIDTVTYETAYVTESIAYETVYEDVRTVPKGKTKVKTEGKNGEKTYTYTLTIVNGVEESRELVSEAVTKNPKNRVLYRGIGGTVTSGGKTYNYSYYIDVKGTVYSIVGNTATGRPTSTSVMAVDPSVIPLNSKCVVKGSADYGYRIAADTGGSIKGNKIDLWYPAGTFPGGFGWKSMRVYILE